MHTIALDHDGRTWYGRKLYRITLKGQTGKLAHTGITRHRAVTLLREIGIKLIIENRPHTYEGGAL